MVYSSLISISRHSSDLTPFSTSSSSVRHTLGTSHPPPARLTCRQFDDEIQAVMHGPRFPIRLFLHLDISDSLSTISTYEKLPWEEEVEFHGVPKRYMERVEMVEIECDLSPNHQHYVQDERRFCQQVTVMEWMASQLDWIRYDLLKEGGAIREVRLRFTVGHVVELEAFEKQLPVLKDWKVVKRAQCVYEGRHGTSTWMGCDHSLSDGLLRRVTVERTRSEWIVEKSF